MPPQLSQISIIIVTHNSLPCLADFLQALKKSETDIGEIILIDNNSDDDSIAVARDIYPDINVIENSENVGFASACNQGAALAGNEFILFVNPDLELDTNSIKTLSDFLTNNSRAGAVTGRLRFSGGSFQPNCRAFPTRSNIFLARGGILGRVTGKSKNYTLGDSSVVMPVPAMAGALLMIRRELFLSVNGFDERFFMYMEDTDLCLRLNQAGFTNYFLPKAGAIHHWGRGSRVRQWRRNFWHHRSVYKYFTKHDRGFYSLAILPLLLIANLLLVNLLPFTRRKGS